MRYETPHYEDDAGHADTQGDETEDLACQVLKRVRALGYQFMYFVHIIESLNVNSYTI